MTSAPRAATVGAFIQGANAFTISLFGQRLSAGLESVDDSRHRLRDGSLAKNPGTDPDRGGKFRAGIRRGGAGWDAFAIRLKMVPRALL